MKTRKFTALLLVLCLLLTATPYSAPVHAVEEEHLAQEQTQTQEETRTATETAETTTAPLAEGVFFQFVDQAVFQANGHVARVPEEETLSTYVFRNSDGTKTVYYLPDNVKYVAENGTMVDKDLTLVSETGGYGVARSDIAYLLPTSAASGIRMAHGSRQVTMYPQASLGRATDAAVSGNSVRYANYFGSGIHLVYTPIPSGLKEDIILDSYTGVSSFTFTIDTNGMRLYNDEGQYYFAASADAEEQIFLGDIVVYDAKGEPSAGTLTVATVTMGQQYTLTVSADPAFLTDPDTVYPVTIDPTLTVSDNTHGAGAIEDASLYQNAPNANTGSWTYNHCGYYASANTDYGVCRTAIRLAGLKNDQTWQNISYSNINSAKFYVKEATGASSVRIVLYKMTNSTWKENTATWSTVANAYESTAWAQANLASGAWAEFDFTGLAREWKRSNASDYSFMLVSINNTLDKSFYSSEYADPTCKPYLVVTYNEQFAETSGLNYTTKELEEGNMFKLRWPDVSSSITWTSSNTAIATVSSVGTVTAHKAGTVTITAHAGGYAPQTCTVHVHIPNGVYYIKNLNSNLYLHVAQGHITDGTGIIQYSKYNPATTSDTYLIRQMWKIHYLGEGKYSVRPMNKLDKGLDVTGSKVDIYTIGEADTLSSIPDYGEWAIQWYSTGYTFQQKGNSNYTMQVQNAATTTNAAIVAQPFTTAVNCRWEMFKIETPPSGVYWYDISNDKVIMGSHFTDLKYVIYNQPQNSRSMDLVAIAYSPTTNSQSFSWSAANPEVVTIGNTSGNMISNNSGKTTVYAQKTISDSSFTLSLDVVSIGLDQYTVGVRIGTINGKQYYDYTIPVNQLFQDAAALCEDHRCMNWIQYCSWATDISVLYEPSLSEHLGMQLGSFLWFYGQVKHGAEWDIKVPDCWAAALPGVPFLYEDDTFGEFIFRGELTTAESLGNIMYGYTGRATGFGETTLYWGGGVAAQGSVNCDEVTTPPYYGDDENDHDNIQRGFNMFIADYPNYPAVGYDGIPMPEWFAPIADVLLDVAV